MNKIKIEIDFDDTNLVCEETEITYLNDIKDTFNHVLELLYKVTTVTNKNDDTKPVSPINYDFDLDDPIQDKKDTLGPLWAPTYPYYGPSSSMNANSMNVSWNTTDRPVKECNRPINERFFKPGKTYPQQYSYDNNKRPPRRYREFFNAW